MQDKYQTLFYDLKAHIANLNIIVAKIGLKILWLNFSLSLKYCFPSS